MGIKKMSLDAGRLPRGAAAEAVAPRRSVFAKGSAGADKGGLGRTPVEQLSGWLTRMPFASQQRALTVGVVVSLVALLASVYLDNRQATNGAAQIEIAGNMLMHSQRLGKAVPVALGWATRRRSRSCASPRNSSRPTCWRSRMAATRST